MERLVLKERFCEECGTPLVNGVCQKCHPINLSIPEDKSKYSKIFVDPNEQFVDALKNSYFKDFITSGRIKCSNAIISDKRLYSKYNTVGNKNETKIIDLKDVTGSGIIRFSSLLKVISIVVGGLSILASLILLLICFDHHEDELVIAMSITFGVGIIIILLSYIIKVDIGIKSILKIEYAGGNIEFSTKWYSREKLESFHKNLRIAKDNVVKAEQDAIQQSH